MRVYFYFVAQKRKYLKRILSNKHTFTSLICARGEAKISVFILKIDCIKTLILLHQSELPVDRSLINSYFLI